MLSRLRGINHLGGPAGLQEILVGVSVCRQPRAIRVFVANHTRNLSGTSIVPSAYALARTNAGGGLLATPVVGLTVNNNAANAVFTPLGTKSLVSSTSASVSTQSESSHHVSSSPPSSSNNNDANENTVHPTIANAPNRWTMVPPAVGTTLCIGSLYAFSVFSGPLARSLGVVVPSGEDWALSSVVPIFSTILAFHGISAAVFGKWQERVGPRKSILAGAFTYGGGYLLGAVGAHMHSLPLIILGYGVLAGTGVGLAYTPPMATLLRWFPDRRGLATGMALCGFGGGALVTTPIADWLLKHARKAPEYLGSQDSVNIVTQAGRRYVAEGGGEGVMASIDGGSAAAAVDAVASGTTGLREVVVANAAELTHAGFSFLEPGVYAVGTGSTGVAFTFAALGVGYFAVMLTASWAIRPPPVGYEEAITNALIEKKRAIKQAHDHTPPETAAAAAGVSPSAAIDEHAPSSSAIVNALRLIPTRGYVNADVAMKTPQFWQIWIQVACMASGGFALATVAKTMMSEIFGAALPHIVTSAFASSFVMAMSVANLGGRLGWASFSDIIGRKTAFLGFSVLSVPLYIAMTQSATWVSNYHSVVPLVTFYAAAFFAFSFFAGMYSTAPALEADLFGSKYVGAIHGRMLTANAVAALTGPPVVGVLRSSAEFEQIKKLTENVDAAKFLDKFGAPVTQLEELVEAKTVTIKKLLDILPPETVDPTPLLYHSTLYTMAGLMCISSLVVMRLGPVDQKYIKRS